MNKEQKKFEEVVKKRRSHAKRVRARKVSRKRPHWIPVPKKMAEKMGLVKLPWYERVWQWLTKWG